MTVHAEFCDAADKLPSFVGEPAPNLAWLDVHAGKINISEEERSTTPGRERLPRGPDGSITYHAYILPSVDLKTYQHWRPEQAWNLFDNPHDVCLEVRGSDLALFQSSNTVRIPQGMIRSALHKQH